MTALWPLLAAGFGVAFVHAALPTHWLPFVLAGRAQGWRPSRTLGITALAGGGHVLFTVLLGVLAAAAGMAVERWLTDVFPWIAGGLLIAFGLHYLVRQARGQGHGHRHFAVRDPDHGHGHADHAHPHDHSHDHSHSAAPVRAPVASPSSDRTVALGLLAALTFSPCEGFLPVFLAGARHGWLGYLALSVTLALATLLGMLLFTGLALRGMQYLNSETLERHENAIVGGLLLTMGLGIWIFDW